MVLLTLYQIIEMHDLQDETPLEKIWYRDLMPDVSDKTQRLNDADIGSSASCRAVSCLKEPGWE